MIVVELIDVEGRTIMVGVPDEVPFVIKPVMPRRQGEKAHTLLTWGNVYARVSHTPKDVVRIIAEARGEPLQEI